MATNNPRRRHHHMLGACANCGSKLGQGRLVPLEGGAWRSSNHCKICNRTDVPVIFREFECDGGC